MNRTIYVNGEFLPEKDAKISVFDRGFLFADGVYEVSAVLSGKLVDNAAHLARLQRSLAEIGLDLPCSIEEIETHQCELIKRNKLQEGLVYLQITRGPADRDFAFPRQTNPSLVIFTQAKNLRENPAAKNGIAVITVDDLRWRRRDIKTVQLLYASLAKQQALDAGADDAWLVEDGFVTEGTSSNAWIAGKDNTIVTRQISSAILAGITRKAVMKLCAECEITVEERPFTVDEAKAAKEAFLTSATTLVTPVVSIDGVAIAEGQPGELAQRLRAIYLDEAMPGNPGL